MAGKGSPKGVRQGGKQKGQPNKATIEQALEAERVIVQAKKEGRKLGKEMLWDIAELMLGMAAVYQPTHPQILPGQPGYNPHQNEDKFRFYITTGAEVARDLADFQSPKFKAIAIVPPPDQMPGDIPRLPYAGKAMGALEAYQQLRDKDIIDVVPAKTNGAPPASVMVAEPRKKANGNGGTNGHG